MIGGISAREGIIRIIIESGKVRKGKYGQKREYPSSGTLVSGLW